MRSAGRRFRDGAAVFFLGTLVAACASVGEMRAMPMAERHGDVAEKADDALPREPLASEAASLAPRARPEELHAGSVETARRLVSTPELRPRPPALLARTNGRDLEPLPLESLRVAAVAGATRARVLVEAVFTNPASLVVEGTFVARLPDGASPGAMGMFLGGGEGLDSTARLLPPPLEPAWLLEPTLAHVLTAQPSVESWGTFRSARAVEQAQGTVAYERTMQKRVDPALVEWSGGNAFRTRIYPIAARSKKKVAFAYDVPPSWDGERSLVLLPVPEPLPAGFRLDVAADRGAYDRAALVSARGEDVLPERGRFFEGSLPRGLGPGSFLLAARPRDARVSSGADTESDVPGSLVHARIAPRVAPRGDEPTGSAVFLVDTSLSQRGRLARTSAELLRAILERDATIERFQVVTFDVAARPLFAGWHANTPEARTEALDAIGRVSLEGATNLEAALSAVEASVDAKVDASYFLLSDGQLTWGPTAPRELERAHPRLFEARWIGYQLGDSAVNRPLLERLCRRGRIVTVLGEDDVARAALAHRSAPAGLRRVTVEGVSAKDLLVAGAPLAVFPGQTLEVAFRVAGAVDLSKARIVVETDQGVESFGLDHVALGDALAGRAWAELTANKLLELGSQAADRLALALSERFRLVNRVASLLLLETDEEFQWRGIAAEQLDVEAIASAAKGGARPRPAGEPDDASLPEGTRELLARLVGVTGQPWARPTAPRRAPLPPVAYPERLDAVTLHREASRRFEAGDPDEAVRILSSLVEESPRDATTLRLVGFALMGWGRYEDAASLFARVREVRPFEPQALLGEAFALEAQGRLGAAALRYELVLAGRFDFRHEQFAAPAAERLYARLLDGLARGEGELASAARARRDQLVHGRFQQPLVSGSLAPAKHEVYLLWNIDDTDVDLHVQEPGGELVDYGHRESSSGGRLLWDDTVGLGPEIYVSPKLPPDEVFVQYFGTRSVSGTVPAATLVVFFGPGGPFVRAEVLTGVQEKCVLYRATRG